MVKGLEIFRNHFKGFEDKYVLIGGTAASIVFDEAGVDFRVTKDLDIVLCIEFFDLQFARAIWEFIRLGGYSNRQISTGKKLFYRFQSPEDPKYPSMLELFSRIPDSLHIEADDIHLTPIPTEEEISSLSAILIESEYYYFIINNKTIINDLPIIGPEILIPLKAKAWLDLTKRRAEGDRLDSRSIKKHRNDIFRLFPLLPGDLVVECSAEIRTDIENFLSSIEGERIDLRSFGIRTLNINEINSRLKSMYQI